MHYIIKKLAEMSINGHISLPGIRKINYPFYLYVKDNFGQVQKEAKKYGIILKKRRGDYELALYLADEVDSEGRLRILRRYTNEHDCYLYHRIRQRAMRANMTTKEYISYLGYSYDLTKSIRELFDKGYSNSEIAEELGCNRRTVWLRTREWLK